MTNLPTDSQANNVPNLSRLQRRIGYEFQRSDLLNQALTHKSFSKQNNERLEFIGDAVLGYLVGHLLYLTNPDYAEDSLSLMRASLVRGTALAEIAREIDLAPNIRLGSGERKTGGRQRSSILADAFEALIGAIHEDGGIEACRVVVALLFSSRVEDLDPENLKDAKTKLQELLQGRQLQLPEYSVEEVNGADHQRLYTVACEVESMTLKVNATASSRRSAEQAAAALMLEHLSDDQSTGSANDD